MKLGRRLWQTKNTSKWNRSPRWCSYEDMFQHDPEWNITASASGWNPENLHLLADLVRLAAT